ncbi:MAG: DUF4168 domain-containing protein [Cyanobacteria bacterium J06623_5]
MSDIGSLNRMFLSWKLNLKRCAVSFFRAYFLPAPAIRRAQTPCPRQVFSRLAIAIAVLLIITGIPSGSLAASVPTLAVQNTAAPQNAADTNTEGTESVQAVTNSADVAAEKVDQFAQAYMQILQLLSDREPELPAAATTAEALKIERSIEADAFNIIESTGLTLPEYMQILSLASQDDTFQDKILGRIDDTAESN